MANKTESIYTDHNGVAVTAMTTYHNGRDVWGHSYMVSGLNRLSPSFQMVDFQKGPVPANGNNGLTNEQLLAILIHRTEYLDTQYPCVQNRHAIVKMKEALELFEARTKDRQLRGVEGVNTP